MGLETVKLPSVEQLKEKIKQCIEQASKNPMAENRLAEIELQLSQMEETFLQTGTRSSEQLATEDRLEQEIKDSTAIADNLVEFKTMLEQLSEKYGSEHGWVENYLAHENAHANAGAETGHEWVGYGTVFLKDETGNLSHIQPLHFTKPKLEWGPREMLAKRIEVTAAPEKYGDKLSDADTDLLQRDQQRLRELGERETRDRARLTDVRKQLAELE